MVSLRHTGFGVVEKTGVLALKYYLVLLVSLTALGAPPAHALVVLDLPELAGDYSHGGDQPSPVPSVRTTSFVFPDSIASIEGLRLKVSGPWFPGQKETCHEVGGVTFCDTLPVGTTLVLELTAESLDECYFQATVPAYNWVNGNELLVEICSEGSTDIKLLLGSEVNAELHCEFPPETLPDIVEATYGTLLEVKLETVGTVPSRLSTWGGVKSLFR